MNFIFIYRSHHFGKKFMDSAACGWKFILYIWLDERCARCACYGSMLCGSKRNEKHSRSFFSADHLLYPGWHVNRFLQLYAPRRFSLARSLRFIISLFITALLLLCTSSLVLSLQIKKREIIVQHTPLRAASSKRVFETEKISHTHAATNNKRKNTTTPIVRRYFYINNTH